jgi:hypothetical protein
MPKELDIRLESLTYTARFAKPVFGLWGKGGDIVGPLYDSLSPYGVTLGNIVVHPGAANAAEPVITVWVRGNSTVKFAFDRVEFALNNFTQDFFEEFPRLFKDTTSWIKGQLPKFQFASHNFGYFCHAMVKASTAKAVLDTINPKSLRAAGISRGSGSIFHSSVTGKNWTTRITFDHSVGVPGALFIGLFIDTNTGELDHQATLVDARAYFRSILAEVDLALPELAN